MAHDVEDGMAGELQPLWIDRSDLLGSPIFWANHFWETTQNNEPLEEFVGYRDSELAAFQKKEMKSHIPGKPHFVPYYAISLPLLAGCSVAFVHEAYPEDYGLAYYVHRPAWECPLLLCRMPSCCDWPPFRWVELAMLVDAIHETTDKPILRNAALPLLMPAVWLAADDRAQEVRRRVAAAWKKSGAIKPARLAEAVGLMVHEGRMRWTYRDRFGWVNDGQSLRNPKHSPASAMRSRGFFKKVTSFFSAAIIDPLWRTPTVLSVAKGIRKNPKLERLPILADALEEAGCRRQQLLAWVRQPEFQKHGRWLADLLSVKD
jgi:hypothetical protein